MRKCTFNALTILLLSWGPPLDIPMVPNGPHQQNITRRCGDPEGYPCALAVSAVEGGGLDQAWAHMTKLAEYRKSTGFWATRRADQARHWFEDEVRQGLLSHLESHAQAKSAMEAAREDVAKGLRTPGTAASEVLARLTGEKE